MAMSLRTRVPDRTSPPPAAKSAPAPETGVAPANAGTPSTERARYFDSGNAFALKYPPVPCHQFLAERDLAFDPATATGLIALDLSDRLGTRFPATTPLMLTRYARIRAGERLTTRFKASGELYYVFEGSGQTLSGAERIGWGPGDVFCLPGGGETIHLAGTEDAVLWVTTNEPELAFEHLEPPAPGNAVTRPVHYPAAEIRDQLARVAKKLERQKIAGLALVFSSVDQAERRNVLPSLTLAVNQLPPRDFQRPHTHNSAAITLSLEGRNCYSMIDGERVDWQEHAVMVTPPGAVHSHHNDGDSWMSCLIVQDGGLHYHCRTMDFRYADG
ncbi:MAG TPA: cupin domain-containing protein [Geminicoccaceae bacterium]|nr:cupin domain-containing protein [Geminicoccaceae bacterium]